MTSPTANNFVTYDQILKQPEFISGCCFKELKCMEKIQQISIKGLLYRDNKVLLLKTPTDRWELPGGRMNFGENVEQTFKREIKEEIRFENVKMGNLVNAWSFIVVIKEINRHFIVFDFEIFTDESKIELSDEHTEYKWIGKDDFEEKNMHEGHKESLRKYFG